MNNKEYFFYFDESFHDRSIKLTNKNEVNIFRDGNSDIFIGSFIGISEDNLNAFENDFLKFENNYKKIFTINNEKELKGTVIGAKNFKYGISSFNSNTTNFYNDFFDVLINNNCIIQLDFFSKIQFLIQKIFEDSKFQYTIVCNFIYSIAKFSLNYRELGIADKILDEKLNSSEVVEEMKSSLKIILSKIENIPRKRGEKLAIQQMIGVLNNVNIINKYNKIKWDYSPIFDGFNKFLKSCNIKASDINLNIDEEKNIFNTAKNINEFRSLKSCDSKEVLGVRAADILSNLLGRLIFSIQDTLLEKFEGEVKKEQVLIPKRWFDLKKEQFDLICKINTLFNMQSEGYIYRSIYSDYMFVLIQYITYISKFDNYINYKKSTIEDISKEINNNIKIDLFWELNKSN
ncbi:hypothetical protein [Clostridium perfringens]|uniref:hypothetical protein n=1 Tax=Clostridium perfringens TaxID=1502 RepID=UPI001C85021B|nr:hypothetical protein [Clostridium perfringens]EJT6169366.1 hypothetical protein [Clostridium perfringens]EJT6622438.1 hypothetical protein [Clostridium perfringens]